MSDYDNKKRAGNRSEGSGTIPPDLKIPELHIPSASEQEKTASAPAVQETSELELFTGSSSEANTAAHRMGPPDLPKEFVDPEYSKQHASAVKKSASNRTQKESPAYPMPDVPKPAAEKKTESGTKKTEPKKSSSLSTAPIRPASLSRSASHTDPNPKSAKKEHAKREPVRTHAVKETGRTKKSGKQPETDANGFSLSNRSGHILVSAFMIFMVLGVIAGFAGTMWFQNLISNVPPLDINKRDEYSSASVIYDRNGKFVAEYGTNENVEWADSDEIPQTLKDAFVAIEDQRFYEHNGIDLKRLVSAVLGQITGGSSHGASTITQQVIKNTHLSQEVSYTRKAMEIHLALELDKTMSKDDILVWYMNTVYFGDSNYGVKVAAKDYFGKELKDLTLRECAILAGLAQSPNAYNPRLNMLKGDMGPTTYRTNTVLYAMHNTGKITDAQYQAALNDKLHVLEASRRYELYDYPIYVEYAVENVAKKLLEAEQVEINDETMADKKHWLRTCGYNIYTAFDTHIQDVSQEAIANFDNYPALVNGTQVQASAVIMDQRTGEVVAMIGGLEEPTEPEGFNRATDSTQAVGSSIKPLSVYAPACETGDYPGTTVMDTQESIQGYGEDNSYPNGDHTGGAITMRKALELSHNIPAARFLLEHVGIDRGYDFMVQEGFSPANLAKTAAGLALGATDVTTLEMTAAYACLANGGVYIEPHAFQRVTDRFGNEILNGKDVESHRVFSKATAWLTTDMMESNVREGYGVNAKLPVVRAAGKTGTHEHKVISFGGYTPYYTSFVRISADDYVNMINSSSYYQSAPLWRAYMEPIHEGLEDREIQDFSAEDVGIKQYWVCMNSGQLAQSWCEGHYEYAAPSNAPTVQCEGHNYGWTQEWNEWDNTQEYINYDDPEWWTKGWWDEEGNFHPY